MHMKKNTIVILFALAGAIIALFILARQKSGNSSAPQNQGNDSIPQNQVYRAIQTFVNLLDSEDVREFGLKSIDELKLSKPGKQFKYFMIAVADIKNYKAGEDVSKIIKEYPSIEVSLVNATGSIISSIEFVKNQGRWEPGRYGSSAELLSVRNAQTTIADSTINKGSLVRIPGLNTSFVSVSDGSKLNFIVLADKLSLNLKKGLTLPASEVILRLVPLAKKHKGLPN